MLTLKNHDNGHEVGIDCVKVKPKETTNQNS
jgi:hypothetical protein